MSNNRARAHDVGDDGLLLGENGLHLISGSASPQGAINPTFPTMYIQTTDGTRWYHTGTGGINAWSTDLLNVLTGMVATYSTINATDSIRTAIGKIKGWIELTRTFRSTSSYNNTSSTVGVSITNLAFTVAAGKTYEIQMLLRYQSAAGNRGIGVAFTSTGAVGNLTGVGSIMAGADGLGSLYSGAITAFDDYVQSTTSQAADTDSIARVSGIFVCTTGGTITPVFKSSNNGINMLVQPNSILTVKEIQ